MPSVKERPKTLTETIDALERIREELLTLQRALEKLEPGEERLADRDKKAMIDRGSSSG